MPEFKVMGGVDYKGQKLTTKIAQRDLGSRGEKTVLFHACRGVT